MPENRLTDADSQDPFEHWPKATARKMKAIRKKYSHWCPWTESNPRYDMHAQFNEYKIRYGYQRLNLSFTQPWRDQPYPELRKLKRANCLHLLFTSSGQGAALSTFYALKAKGVTRVQTAEPISYYETSDLLSRIGFKSNQSRSRKKTAFLLDSSTLSTRRFSIPDCGYLVVDTTCWDLSDKIIAQTVKRAIKRKMIVVLIRSHTKLDSFGTEWGRLGSIVTIASENCGGAFEVFRKDIIEFSAAFGARAEIRSLYPFLNEKKHGRLVSRWVQKIRKSNARLQDDLGSILNSEFTEIISFDHCLFIWIKLKSIPFEMLLEHENLLTKDLAKAGIPALVIASFPWDFVAITTFDMALENGGKAPVLRLSCPPQSVAQAKKTVSVVNSFLRKLENASLRQG